MRKIILNLATTLDGFIEGANGELDWCILEEDMQFNSFLESIDTIFYGRVSYDLWGNYQPDASASDMEKEISSAIQRKKKFVFSSQSRVDDKATFISTDVVAQVEKNQGSTRKRYLALWRRQTDNYVYRERSGR